ncbi:MAG TPA: NUDIX hydrolase [Candidatus Micrarchaeia archaeon]|nr:NUDIX hydrolase [Candidatus Micrarchaeia archaeon]
MTAAPGPEELLGSDERFRGRIVSLSVDTVRLGDGQVATREVLHHPGGVAVVAVDAALAVWLVRQYRHPARTLLWELPAGTREPGETAEATGRRELAEETGQAARTWVHLGAVYLAPGYSSELLHLYRASDLGPAPGAVPDADELLEARPFTGAELAQLTAAGELRDAKTVAGLALAGFLQPVRARVGGGGDDGR